jgi:hypothetical protein
LFGTNFEVALVFVRRALAAISYAFTFQARSPQSEIPAVFFTGGVVMIFDIVSVAILFQILRVFSRLIGQRHGDVLDYIARQESTLV